MINLIKSAVYVFIVAVVQNFHCSTKFNVEMLGISKSLWLDAPDAFVNNPEEMLVFKSCGHSLLVIELLVDRNL